MKNNKQLNPKDFLITKTEYNVGAEIMTWLYDLKDDSFEVHVYHSKKIDYKMFRKILTEAIEKSLIQ